mmetsp:Transcript_26781/g.56942  ORF Transcript_26781/g.56942 Transcript_26781/m.56942 type:complete len:200 (-) Transcript_26781:32-631(-)
MGLHRRRRHDGHFWCARISPSHRFVGNRASSSSGSPRSPASLILGGPANGRRSAVERTTQKNRAAIVGRRRLPPPPVPARARLGRRGRATTVHARAVPRRQIQVRLHGHASSLVRPGEQAAEDAPGRDQLLPPGSAGVRPRDHGGSRADIENPGVWDAGGGGGAGGDGGGEQGRSVPGHPGEGSEGGPVGGVLRHRIHI